MKADELKEECETRDFAHDCLTKDQMKAELIQYEKDLDKEGVKAMDPGETVETRDSASAFEREIILRKLDFQERELEYQRQQDQREFEYKMRQLEVDNQ